MKVTAVIIGFSIFLAGCAGTDSHLRKQRHSSDVGITDVDGEADLLRSPAEIRQ